MGKNGKGTTLSNTYRFNEDGEETTLRCLARRSVVHHHGGLAWRLLFFTESFAKWNLGKVNHLNFLREIIRVTLLLEICGM
ncbi:hypothetical protein L195_g022997 [Trifolium pratense]|uniref:Uncharacterized protein n=1 Tax=Trifolium pratense TaxID=57577 RepID=A0A2K3N9M0_TRIPR|nr:hypothetical protein L195_g022997 [Trifolium pratense]